MEAWRPLIGRAVTRLWAVGLDTRDWIWGGTVLMLRYQHRESRDVDIFINDVKYLSTFRRVSMIARRTNCASNVPKERWTFSRSPSLSRPQATDHEPGQRRERHPALAGQGDPGSEAYYRATGFTGRDLYGLVVVTRSEPDLLLDQDLQCIAERRRDALEVALASPNCERSYANVARPTVSIPFSEARFTLLDWIGTR